jgi:hypothetical protein
MVMLSKNMTSKTTTSPAIIQEPASVDRLEGGKLSH